MISVDTKKKELVGADPGYKNNGRDYQPKGRPIRVGVHDLPDPQMPKAVPYGIYDLAANTGWVSVGCDGDTAAFAGEAPRSAPRCVRPGPSRGEICAHGLVWPVSAPYQPCSLPWLL